MPEHLLFLLCFLGILAAIIWLLVLIHNRDKRRGDTKS
jgi:hypothetical protein